MILFTSNTSPFVRKVRIVVREKGLTDKVADTPINVFELPADILATNPLARIPALLFADGRTMFGSNIIAEYFDSIGTGPKLIPEGDGANGRWAVKRWEALADGMLDAGVNVRLGQVFLPKEFQYAPEIKRQMDKIERTLSLLETEIDAFGNSWHIGSTAIAAALSWLDIRFANFGWRTRYPRLAAFEESCDDHHSYASTHFIV